MDALKTWKDYCIMKGYKVRTINRKLMIAKMLFKYVIETAGNEIPYSKRQSILEALNNIKKIKDPRPADIKQISQKVFEIRLIGNLPLLEKGRDFKEAYQYIVNSHSFEDCYYL